jgi:SulP family sulfate permease
MRKVPVIDATGLHAIKDVLKMCENDKTKMILSGVQPKVLQELQKSRLLFRIGKRFILPDFKSALVVAKEVLREKSANEIGST